jgi:prolipoprotein diacylglyceryltransferase
LYLVLAGAIRFGIEFVRINLPIVGSLTLAQLISGALILSGAALLLTASDRSTRTR